MNTTDICKSCVKPTADTTYSRNSVYVKKNMLVVPQQGPKRLRKGATVADGLGLHTRESSKHLTSMYFKGVERPGGFKIKQESSEFVLQRRQKTSGGSHPHLPF
ncbi:hypothetical protein R3I94_020203 [Phoxinus phoxinus]